VWEIGPGIGAMTRKLAGRVKKLTVFEIDRGFCRILADQFENTPGWTLVEGDFLKTWPFIFSQEGFPDCILGNLPYNAGSVMIADLVKTEGITSRMVFTLQKEVVKRMTAAPGTRDYSGFSALCQFVCDVTGYGDLHSGSFFPSPRVVSSIVSLIPHFRYSGVNRDIFFQLVNDMFAARRKTLRNNLLNGALARLYGKDVMAAVLEAENLGENRRGEELDFGEIIDLTDCINGMLQDTETVQIEQD